MFGLGLGIFFIILNFIDPIFAIGYPLITTEFITNVLMILFVAGIGEEIIFRSTLATYLGAVDPDTKRKVIAIAIVALAFSAFHWRFYGVDLETAFIGAGLFGVVAGAIAVQRESILPVIIMHIIFNAYLFGKEVVHAFGV